MSISDSHSLAASRIDHYLMERALRRRAQPSAPPTPVQTRPVITLSEATGISVGEIADKVARMLGFHVLDRQVLEAILRDTRLGDRIIEALDEGSRSAVDVWISGWVDYDHRVVDVRSFHHMVSRVVRGISMHGNAVIVGRGANLILRGTEAFRVRLTAPIELRVSALVASGLQGKSLTPVEARHYIAEQTEKRRHFIATHFRANIDDPEAYDAIFCLRRLDPDHAAGLIVDAYQRTVGC